MNCDGVNLSKQVECLEARVRDLEHILKLDLIAPPECRLTRIQLKIFGLLLSREIADRDSIFTAVYGIRANGGPEPKTIEVHMVNLRRQLRPHGINIKNKRSEGYYLTPEMKVRARAFLRNDAETAQ